MGLMMPAPASPEARARALGPRPTQQGVDHPELLDHLARLSAAMQRLDEAAEAARRLSPTARLGGPRTAPARRDPGARSTIPQGVVDALREALWIATRRPRDAPFDAAALSQAAGAQPAPARPAGRGRRRPLEGAAVASRRPTAGELADPEAQLAAEPRLSAAGSDPRTPPTALARSGSYRRREPARCPSRAPTSARRPVPRATAKRAGATTARRHARTFHHGRRLARPAAARPTRLADPDDPKVTAHRRARGRPDRGPRPARRPGLRRWSSSTRSGRRERYVTMIGRDDAKNYRACGSRHYRHGRRPQAGAGPRATSAIPIRRGRPRPADRRARRRGPLPVLPRDPLSRLPRSRRRTAGPSPGGRRPGHRLRAVPRARRQPSRGDQARDFKDRRARRTRDRQCRRHPGRDRSTPSAPTATSSGSPSRSNGRPTTRDTSAHPGVTLTVSRCYTESDGGMSCMTCHDPHREAEHSVGLLRGEMPGLPLRRRRDAEQAVAEPARHGPSARSTRPRTASTATCPRSRCPPCTRP